VHVKPIAENADTMRPRLISTVFSAARLLRAKADRQRVAAIGAGIAARAERQPRDDPRRLGVERQQVAPPRVAVAVLRQRQDADRDASVGDRADHLKGRLVRGHRRVAAVMIAREVPDPERFGRRIDANRERALQLHGRGQQLAPNPHQRSGWEIVALALHQPADNLRLARRNMRGEAAIAFLRGDVGDDPQALDQQILQAVVNPVEAAPQFVKIGLG
jgi:hypothetical protein